MSILIYDKPNVSVRCYETGMKIFDGEKEVYVVVENGKLSLKDAEGLNLWHEKGNCYCCKRKDS